MDQSNEQALDILLQHRVRALTDVTGFGLLGHLSEMLRASGLGVSLNVSAAALLPGAADAFAGGVQSSLHQSNALALGDYQVNVPATMDPAVGVLMDPQTSGGLLAAVPPDGAQQCACAASGGFHCRSCDYWRTRRTWSRRDCYLTHRFLHRLIADAGVRKSRDGWLEIGPCRQGRSHGLEYYQGPAFAYR